MKDRLRMVLQGWKGKLFSIAGKEVLIKVVAQSIPTYIMSCFQLPVSICKEIQNLIAQFWWTHRGRDKGIHWLKWEELCKAKKNGGLGFRDIQAFNQAMLAKLAWKIHTEPHSLIAQLLRAKYCTRKSVLEVYAGQGSSYLWRSVIWGRGLMKNGLHWRIGRGELVGVYVDRWLPTPTTFMVSSPPTMPINSKVCDLLTPSSDWNIELIDRCFLAHDAATILSIPLTGGMARDREVWHYETHGRYTVRSGYLLYS
ncbi:uncharacterized protein LOC110747404 [Prunus avium]|uniref:Uncharacterized protein LOC110747404 n=1 Tax=Prunus avium TaxID=42229 RepID=A0A6P5REE8_PRUAV|nr:uncharacterized protein LOC110747404 [Prunus avium]